MTLRDVLFFAGGIGFACFVDWLINTLIRYNESAT
jgi:hypothetical protein